MDNSTVDIEIKFPPGSDSAMASWANSSSPDLEEIGLDDENALRVHAYLTINPDAAVPYVAMVAIALIVGTIGNVLIIGAYCIWKKVRIIGNEYIFNLAIADLFITAVADPLCIIGVTHGRKFFDERPILCELVACMCLSACFCAFFNLGLITLNRYIYICHNSLYPKLFSRKKIIAMCIGTWVLAFLVEMPNFFHSGHGFDMKNLQCIWMRTATAAYTLIVGVLLIGMPLILMTIAYILIFLTIQRSKRRVFIHSAFNGPDLKKREFKETLKSARSLFIVVLAFLVCWTPYVVVILIDLKDKLSLRTHLYVTFLAHLHSSLTSTIYALTNPNFREGYIKFLTLIWTGRVEDSVVSSSSDSTNGTTSSTVKKVNVTVVGSQMTPPAENRQEN